MKERKSTNVDFAPVDVVNSDDEDGEDGKENEEKTEDMGYQQTLMYGRYRKSLADDVKEVAKRQKLVEKLRKKEVKKRQFESELLKRNSCVRKV